MGGGTEDGVSVHRKTATVVTDVEGSSRYRSDTVTRVTRYQYRNGFMFLKIVLLKIVERSVLSEICTENRLSTFIK